MPSGPWNLCAVAVSASTPSSWKLTEIFPTACVASEWVSTPRAWLSTWSGLSSNAAVETNGPRVTVPSLVLNYRGDNAIFPADARRAFASLGADDKQLASAPGDHYGFAVGTQERTGAPRAIAQVVDWLRPRFPA